MICLLNVNDAWLMSDWWRTPQCCAQILWRLSAVRMAHCLLLFPGFYLALGVHHQHDKLLIQVGCRRIYGVKCWRRCPNSWGWQKLPCNLNPPLVIRTAFTSTAMVCGSGNGCCNTMCLGISVPQWRDLLWGLDCTPRWESWCLHLESSVEWVRKH